MDREQRKRSKYVSWCRLLSARTCSMLLFVCKIDLYNLLHWNLDPSSLVPEVYWFELFSYGHIGLGYWASNLIMLQSLEQNMFNISVYSLNRTCFHHFLNLDYLATVTLHQLMWSEVLAYKSDIASLVMQIQYPNNQKNNSSEDKEF